MSESIFLMLRCVLVLGCIAWLTPNRIAFAEPQIASTNASTGAARSELVFVDAMIRQRQLLSFGQRANADVIVLDAGIPLLEQVALHVQGRRNVGAIHIITHGETGAVLTQNSRLDQNMLHQTSPAITNAIAEALSADADIMFYGCNIARGPEGEAFLKALAERTQADIAASDNDTGHASLEADWTLEFRTGPVEAPVSVAQASQQAWQDKLTVRVTIASSTGTLLNALNPSGTGGVTFTGTPSILGSFSSNAYGTFTTNGSNLGMAGGVVFGTGDVSQVSGAPSFAWDGAGTGNTSGVEFDRAALTFSFVPTTGVTKIVFRYVMGSEEYNEYVGQNFSDNITIRMTGGIYNNTNVATIPNTSTGIDIDTINNTINPAFYRDNTIVSPPVPDSVLDGHTTLLKSVTTVVPGTSYTAEIKVADFTDPQFNTALFVDYFGASLQLDLDSNNSSGAVAANYQTTFTEAGAAVAIADTDSSITNLDSTPVQSAIITLTNAQADDSLTYGAMPSGITASTNTSVAGVITVTLTGTASIASYQTAISSVLFSNSSNLPNTTARNVNVSVNDGTTNSNTASTAITVIPIPTYLYTVSKSASVSSIATPGDVNYSISIVNTGDGNMTGVNVTDVLSQAATNTSLILTGPTGDAGVPGQFDIGETWEYAATLPVTQARLDNGNDLMNTVSVTSTQTNPVVQTASATTTIVKNPNLVILKSADTAGPVNANNVVNYTYLVSNTGNITIYNVSVTDTHDGLGSPPIPGSETLSVDAAPLGDSTDSGASGVWDRIAPGDSVLFTSSYLVTQADVDRGP